MAPHSEDTSQVKNGNTREAAMGASKNRSLKFPTPPKWSDPREEQQYLKGRLAAAFRIFGKNGYDEGVAGHITVRVRPSHPSTYCIPMCTSFNH
jgi:hypothetical protein